MQSAMIESIRNGNVVIVNLNCCEMDPDTEKKPFVDVVRNECELREEREIHMRIYI